MKTLSTIILSVAVLSLVACGPDNNGTTNQAAQTAKPPIATPIADSPPSSFGITASNDPPPGVTKPKTK